MKYCYTAVYAVKGISPLADGDKELVVDSDKQLRVVLTSQPDPFCAESDRNLACRCLMLRLGIGGKIASGEPKQRLADEVSQIRGSRQRQFGGGPFLVFQGEGEVASFNFSEQNELDDFVICFDGAPKEPIQARFASPITAVFASLATVFNGLIGVSKICDTVVYFREDGKPIYSITVSCSAAVIAAQAITAGQVTSAGRLYRFFAADEFLQRVQRLIKSSLESDNDNLRSFLSAWAALEIFVNKVFRADERGFCEAVGIKGTDAQASIILRIREILKDGRLGIADKFALIGLKLSPESADEDFKSVKRAKKTRDELFHGEGVNEATLPSNSVRDLASKYLRLYMEKGATTEDGATSAQRD